MHQRRPLKMTVLDMDSSESPTYGEQDGSTYNRHFGRTCYHALFVFNQLGDVERCGLSRATCAQRRWLARGDAAWLVPTLRLIGETGVEAAHLVSRLPDRALEQVSDSGGVP